MNCFMLAVVLAAALPGVPRTGATVEAFVPKGWTIESQLEAPRGGAPEARGPQGIRRLRSPNSNADSPDTGAMASDAFGSHARSLLQGGHVRRSAIIFSMFFIACSHKTICESGVDQVCEREFECQPQQVKDSDQFKMAFGATVQECKTNLYANPLRPAGATGVGCSAITKDQELCANIGQPALVNFDLGKAQECKKQRADLECSAFLAQVNPSAPGGMPPPAVCQERCK